MKLWEAVSKEELTKKGIVYDTAIPIHLARAIAKANGIQDYGRVCREMVMAYPVGCVFGKLQPTTALGVRYIERWEGGE